MFRLLFSIFLVLHGLVHFWYFTLSHGLVAFQPEMGWSGHSWLFTNLLGGAGARSLASVLYPLAALLFVVGGIGFYARWEWAQPLLLGAAAFSAALIFLFWDGQAQLLVEKGILGLLVDIGIIFVLTVPQLGWEVA